MSSDAQFRVAVRRFGPFESAIRKQWECFERDAQTGLTLDAQAFDLPELSEAVFPKPTISSDPWDAVFINTDWVLAAYAKNAVADLARFLRDNPPDGYPEAWTDSLLRPQDVNGFIVGLPYHDGPECLLYRRDLFEDYNEQENYRQRFGQPLRPPETWSEFQQIARYFHRPHEGLYGSVFAAFPDGHNTVYDFLLQLWSRGGELFSKAGKLQLATPAAQEALSFYRAMLQDADALHPRCREMDSVQSGMAFAAGEVAMMVNWFGFAAIAETLDESKVKGRVNLAPIPSGGNGTTVSLNVYWLLAVSAKSARPDVAYSFLRHCAGREMDKLLTLEGGIGCRKSTWQDADVQRVVPYYSRLEQLHRNAREMPRMSEWPDVAHVIDAMMLRAMNTDDSIHSILKDGQEAIERVLS